MSHRKPFRVRCGTPVPLQNSSRPLFHRRRGRGTRANPRRKIKANGARRPLLAARPFPRRQASLIGFIDGHKPHLVPSGDSRSAIAARSAVGALLGDFSVIAGAECDLRPRYISSGRNVRISQGIIASELFFAMVEVWD